jgi:hypothetical protein
MVSGSLFAGMILEDFSGPLGAEWRTYQTYTNTSVTAGEFVTQGIFVDDGDSSNDSPGGVWGGIMHTAPIDLNAGYTRIEYQVRSEDNNAFVPGPANNYLDACFGLGNRNNIYNEYTSAWTAAMGSSYYGENYYVGRPIDSLPSGGISDGANAIQIGYPFNWDDDNTEWAKTGGPGPYRSFQDGNYIKIRLEMENTGVGEWDARMGVFEGGAWVYDNHYRLFHYNATTFAPEPALPAYAYIFGGCGWWAPAAGGANGDYIAFDYVKIYGDGVIPEPTTIMLVVSGLLVGYGYRRRLS